MDVFSRREFLDRSAILAAAAAAGADRGRRAAEPAAPRPALPATGSGSPWSASTAAA